MSSTVHLTLEDEQATHRLAGDLAPALQPGLRIYLRGPLGAGKTTLVRALLRALGFTGRVKSPTYTLVELYPLSRLNLYHFDFYRFRDEAEWRDAGFSEYFDHDGVCLVEWPEKAGAGLPPADLDIAIGVPVAGGDTPSQRRDVVLAAQSAAGQQCLGRLIPSRSPGASS